MISHGGTTLEAPPNVEPEEPFEGMEVIPDLSEDEELQPALPASKAMLPFGIQTSPKRKLDEAEREKDKEKKSAKGTSKGT